MSEALDPMKVYSYVNQALSTVDDATQVGRLQSAWFHIRNMRESGMCYDRELAIAEHYLYARYYV